MFLPKTSVNSKIAVLLVYDGDGRGQVESAVQKTLSGLGNRLAMASSSYQAGAHITSAKLVHDIPKGPYFYSPRTGEIYQAFRLYSDHQLAFTEATLSDGAGGFKPLPATSSVNKIVTCLRETLLINPRVL